MVRELPPNSWWSFAGIGNAQLMMTSLAIASGGGVRVGLEDNIYYDLKRIKLATNIELLQRIHTLAQASERDIMSSAEFRKNLNLKPGKGKYGKKYL